MIVSGIDRSSHSSSYTHVLSSRRHRFERVHGSQQQQHHPHAMKALGISSADYPLSHLSATVADCLTPLSYLPVAPMNPATTTTTTIITHLQNALLRPYPQHGQPTTSPSTPPPALLTHHPSPLYYLPLRTLHPRRWSRCTTAIGSYDA